MSEIAKLVKTLEEYEIDIEYFKKKFNWTIDWGNQPMFQRSYTPIGVKFFNKGCPKTYKNVAREIITDLGWDLKVFYDLKINMGSNYDRDSECYSGYIDSIQLIIKR